MTSVNATEQPSSEPPAVPGGAGLTTGVLARRLGVSPMTLRSWDRRYGIGPTARTEGGHRRWTAADVATIEEMCRLTATGVPPADAARAARTAAAGPDPTEAAVPTSPPPKARSRAAGALPLGDVRQECRGLARAAVRLDAPALEKQLTAAVERYGVVVAWQEVMVPTLHAVGRRWASSEDQYVEVEHLLAWHVSTVLRRSAAPAVPVVPPAAGCVLLACVPGEQHSLPLEALHAALGREGLPVRMLGAAVPVEALDAAVRRLGPVAVVLWAQESARAAPALVRHIAGQRWGMKGTRRGPAVLLGGPGWSRSQPAGLLKPAGLAQAVEALRALCTAG
ncbi:MAG: cobalamin B12-binding domain-containing protein [Streptomyces sp.]|uniref:cobalamin B12-binding domain-containing protein n=1 Tax=Streptomyces sp. TaxID=1931 RepID=UPI0025EF8B4D|nr:cobalamin B12-binding domain-containing protein [Streptomyces sp.]MBW8795586.1 cobalamin B12-binding domain-containing protein [Streptomyces sp.]